MDIPYLKSHQISNVLCPFPVRNWRGTMLCCILSWTWAVQIKSLSQRTASCSQPVLTTTILGAYFVTPLAPRTLHARWPFPSLSTTKSCFQICLNQYIIYTYVYIYIHTCMCIYIYICTNNVYTFLDTHRHIYTYTYIYIYIMYIMLAVFYMDHCFY